MIKLKLKEQKSTLISYYLLYFFFILYMCLLSNIWREMPFFFNFIYGIVVLDVTSFRLHTFVSLWYKPYMYVFMYVSVYMLIILSDYFLLHVRFLLVGPLLGVSWMWLGSRLMRRVIWVNFLDETHLFVQLHKKYLFLLCVKLCLMYWLSSH